MGFMGILFRCEIYGDVIMKKNIYVIGVGKDDEERLSLLNELFGKTSEDLLLKAGLKPGMRVLEVGCGTGSITKWIAKKIGDNGHVTAVDNSQEQIQIAEKNCSGSSNITFITSSLFDLKQTKQFDLVYSRFLIMHLQNPFEGLEHLKQLLKPNGILVSEEATNSVTACYPESPAFKKYREMVMALFQKNNIDYDIGEKLYAYFQKLKTQNIHVSFVQPIYKQHQKKMMTLLMNELTHRCIELGIATEIEIKKLIDDLSNFINDGQFLVSFARTTQIFGCVNFDNVQ